MTKVSLTGKEPKVIVHWELCHTSFSFYNSPVSYYYPHRGTDKLSDLLKVTYLLSLGVKDWTQVFLFLKADTYKMNHWLSGVCKILKIYC